MKLRKPGPLRHEHRILLLALGAGLPGSLVAIILLWTGDFTPKVQWTLATLIGLFWIGFALTAEGWVVRPLQTLSNMLAALREGDYSIRARGARKNDALGELILEANALGETLRQQRLGAVEATLLLRTVMTEIEVAIFTFDGAQRLCLVNRAGERLLAQPAERLLGRSASELGLAECLEGEVPRTAQMVFPGGLGRWGLSRSTFREGGLPHQLLVLTDLSRALREEERQAWQRLLRVLGHELNNSLAPIRSIAGSLESLVGRDPMPPDWQDDIRGGLAVISSRAEALTRFMEAYSRLARLPQPKMQPVDLCACIRRVLSLETRLPIAASPGPAVTIQADGDQLEQLLINLLRNAVDAALETGGGVAVRWTRSSSFVDIVIDDEGPGLSSTANLFVPFFTTKPGGSGIGLVLSRQIAEAHGGSLTLHNRPSGRGCEARLRLPL
jgi:two-component system nitrogen regulation sensor histidine kinase NtrY